MDYLDENIEIAPANSQEEYQAAQTIAEVMRDHGLETSVEEFEAASMSSLLPHILVILAEGELELNTYKTLIEKLPKRISREDILQKALKDGKNFKGREYSQKQLDKLSAQLENYKQNAIRYEQGLNDNRQANREGMPTPNLMKRWIWSQLENTRHFEMDGQEVEYNQYFIVTNEQTGQVDELRFPRDIENDSNNCANICNCQCEWETVN